MPGLRGPAAGEGTPLPGLRHTFVDVTPAEPALPSPPPPSAGRDGRRSVIVIGGLAAVLAVGVVAAFVLPDSGLNALAQDPAAVQGNEQQVAQPVTLESGTWSGDMDASGVALSLDVADGDVTGVFPVRTPSGLVGSWNVKGEVDNGSLTLEPASWISKPDGWSQQALVDIRGICGEALALRMQLLRTGLDAHLGPEARIAQA